MELSTCLSMFHYCCRSSSTQEEKHRFQPAGLMSDVRLSLEKTDIRPLRPTRLPGAPHGVLKDFFFSRSIAYPPSQKQLLAAHWVRCIFLRSSAVRSLSRACKWWNYLLFWCSSKQTAQKNASHPKPGYIYSMKEDELTCIYPDKQYLIFSEKLIESKNSLLQTSLKVTKCDHG